MIWPVVIRVCRRARSRAMVFAVGRVVVLRGDCVSFWAL